MLETSSMVVHEKHFRHLQRAQAVLMSPFVRGRAWRLHVAPAADVLALLQGQPERALSSEPATSLSCLRAPLTKQQTRHLDLDALQCLWEVRPA